MRKKHPSAARRGRPPTGSALTEVHDLAISKYIAGREKDLEFNRELARAGLIDRKTVLARPMKTEMSPDMRKIVAARIRRDS